METKRLIRRPLIGVAAAMVFCLAPLCFGETVVVRVLSESDGAPLAGETVTARLRYADKATIVHEITNASGEAKIDLPRIKPQSLSVSVKIDLDNYSCPCRATAETDTVLHKGLARDAHGHEWQLFADAPGEIIFLARPASVPKRLIYVVAGPRGH